MPHDAALMAADRIRAGNGAFAGALREPARDGA